MTEHSLAQRGGAITPMQEVVDEGLMLRPGIDQEYHFQMRKLGNIHLGVKLKTADGKREYPKATDYIVLPEALLNDPDFREALEDIGENPDQPKRIPIMLMSDSPAVNIVTTCDLYGTGGKLKCRSRDGRTCERLNEKTFQYESLPCGQTECGEFASKACAWYHRLRFMIPDAAGLGYWQIATKSDNNRGALIREMIDLRKALRGRIAGADLILELTTDRTFHVPVSDKSGKTTMISTAPPLLHIGLGKSLRKLQREVVQFTAVDAEVIEDSHDMDDTPTVSEDDFMAECEQEDAETVEDQTDDAVTVTRGLCEEMFDKLQYTDTQRANFVRTQFKRNVTLDELPYEELEQLLTAISERVNQVSG